MPLPEPWIDPRAERALPGTAATASAGSATAIFAKAHSRHFVAFSIGWLAILSPYLGLIVGRPPSATYRDVWALAALALLVAGVALAGLTGGPRSEDRRVRGLIAASFLVWAVSELLEHGLSETSAAFRRTVGDSAFVVVGVLMCAAALVTSERGLSRAQVALRSLQRAEVAIFASGVFVCLVVLPTRFDPELAASPTPSAMVYVTLDLLMFGLYLWRAARAERGDPRWIALAVAAILFLLADALFLASTRGQFDLDRHAIVDLLWYLPHVAVAYALCFGGRPGADLSPPDAFDAGARRGIAPGFLYAALVPVVFLAAEWAGAVSVAGGRTQRLFALGLTLVLLVLAVVHQRLHRAVWGDLRREIAAGERRLAAAAKLQAIGRLAAGVAHDFNNLLTVVVGRAELARARLTDEADQRAFDGILDLAARATGLTSELLAVGEREPRSRTSIELDAFLAARRERWSARSGPEVEVVLELAAGAGRIVVDTGHLDRVLDNLIGNALDATGDCGRLTISTRRQRLSSGWTRHHDEIAAGDYLVVEVRDEGVGMSPERLARVFEPFFTTKDLGRGVGLGLATVRGLVRQNGGQILAHSQPGRGSSFELLFPAEP